MGVFIRLRNVTIVGEFYYLYYYMLRSYDHLQPENILLTIYIISYVKMVVWSKHVVDNLNKIFKKTIEIELH
jgi:hypothetical protein